MAKTLWLRAAVLGLSAGLALGGATFAQGVPAEIPPSSFTGDQYVDSQGCVFVRVGFGSAVEWVPRVGRDRRAICGFTPTGVGSGGGAPDLAADSRVTVIGGAAAPVAAAAPAQVPAAPAQVQVIGAPAPVIPSAPGAATAASGCPNLPAAQRPYFDGADVRCGPQAANSGDQPSVGLPAGVQAGAQGGAVTGTPRSYALSAPPAGYRLAWDDGRLNPYRGLGTPAGEQQMAQVWTNTVPHRAAPVTIDATTVATFGDDRATRARVPLADQPIAPSNEVRVGAGHRHVLAGTFAGQADATLAYGRLASAGLPALIGQVQRQGATVFVVMAGPYGDPQSLGRAVLQARNAGFPDAMTRD